MARFQRWAVFHKGVEDKGKLAKLYVKWIGGSTYTAHNFFMHMNNVLPRKAYHSILDAGCGKGDFTFYLADTYPNSNIEGWDKADPHLHDLGDNIEVCERIKNIGAYQNVTFHKKDLLDLNAENKYDLIVCIHVLEHIPNNEMVLEKFYRALAPGGVLHLQIPGKNDHSFFLLKHFTDFYTWEQEEHIGRVYSMPEMVLLLEQLGFRILTRRTDGHLLSGFLFDLTETCKQKSSLFYALVLPVARVINRLLSGFDNHKGNLVLVASKGDESQKPGA